MESSDCDDQIAGMDTDDNFSDWPNSASEVMTDSLTMPRNYVNVPEKIVFCIDRFLCQNKKLPSLLAYFIETKKLISTKPTDFYLAIYSSKEAQYFLKFDPYVIQNCSNLDNLESRTMDLTILFETLANDCDLPNPMVYPSKPPFNYHFIILFGSIDCVPLLKEANSYYFLASNPFVTIDILYLTKMNSEKSKVVGEILQCLVSNERGYFLKTDHKSLSHSLMKFIGNPLLRSQKQCEFKCF